MRNMLHLCPLLNFGAQGGSPGLKFMNLGNNVHQSQAYLLLCWFRWRLDGANERQTNGKTNIQTCATVEDWCMSPHGTTEPPDKVHKIRGISVDWSDHWPANFQTTHSIRWQDFLGKSVYFQPPHREGKCQSSSNFSSVYCVNRGWQNAAVLCDK